MNYFDSKKGWRKINYDPEYEDLLNIFSEVLEEARNRGILPRHIDDISYYLHNRLQAIANCSYHKYSDSCVDIAFGFNAEVVRQIPVQKLREVVIHEVGHACAIGDGHGRAWQSVCRLIGKKWGFTHFDRIEHDAAINAVMRTQKEARTKYIVSCPACGATWKYTKAGAVVQKHNRCTCGCGWKGLDLKIL